MSNSVGSRIRNIRGKESRASFAEKLDIGTTTLQRYENDERSPDLDFFIKIHEITGYSFDYLIIGKELELPPEDSLIINKLREVTSETKNKILMLLLSDKDTTTKVVHNHKNDVQGQQIGDNNQQDNHFAPKQSSTFNIQNVSGGEVNGIKNMK